MSSNTGDTVTSMTKICIFILLKDSHTKTNWYSTHLIISSGSICPSYSGQVHNYMYISTLTISYPDSAICCMSSSKFYDTHLLFPVKDSRSNCFIYDWREMEIYRPRAWISVTGWLYYVSNTTTDRHIPTASVEFVDFLLCGPTTLDEILLTEIICHYYLLIYSPQNICYIFCIWRVGQPL